MFANSPARGFDRWGEIAAPDNIPRQKELIHEWDWDTLIILDACRYDMLEVALPNRNVEPVSTGVTKTRYWLDDVWIGEDVPEMTYVSTSPWTDPNYEYESGDPRVDASPDNGRKLPENIDVKQVNTDFQQTVRGCTDQLLQTTRPGCVLNYASSISGRKVIHLMKPHMPFIGQISLHATSLGVEELKEYANTYQLLEEEKVTVDLLRAAYYYNLRRALEEIGDYLLKNNDERVVITSDHGEEFKEEDGEYIAGHMDVPVPWVEMEI